MYIARGVTSSRKYCICISRRNREISLKSICCYYILLETQFCYNLGPFCTLSNVRNCPRRIMLTHILSFTEEIAQAVLNVISCSVKHALTLVHWNTATFPLNIYQKYCFPSFYGSYLKCFISIRLIYIQLIPCDLFFYSPIIPIPQIAPAILQHPWRIWGLIQYNHFSTRNPIVEIRLPKACLISTIRFPTMVRWHFHVESGPRL